MSKQRCLITGASGGIGLEFANLFASKGYDLVLIARRKEVLEQIASELHKKYNIDVYTISKDLSNSDSPQEIYNELKLKNIQIDVLVNNAGFATFGLFTEIDLKKELEELQVNIVTLTHLTKLYAIDMVERKSGKILNIASTAAFQPGPLMAVYYASKSYVLSFSEALANELLGTGVTITVLCPGPTKSGFQQRADMEASKLMQSGLMNAAEVARLGYDGLMAGKTVVIPGLKNKIGTFLVKFLPQQTVTKIVRKIQEKKEAQ